MKESTNEWRKERTFDGSRGRGEGDQRAGGLVTDGRAGRVQQTVDARDEAAALARIGVANLVPHINTIKNKYLNLNSHTRSSDLPVSKI